jgi:hypothetical protein
MPVQPHTCPLCGGLLQLDTAWAGQAVACPLCQGTFLVPGAGELPPLLIPPAASAEPAITLACPNCSGPFQALASMAGQTVLCPHCGAPTTVPQVEAPQEVADAERAVTRERNRRRPAFSEASQIDLLPPGAFQRALSPPAGNPPPRTATATQPANPPSWPAPSSAPTDTWQAPPVPAQPSFVEPAPFTPRATPHTPTITTAPSKPALTSEERAERRLRNNAVIFSLCLIILIAVFYYLSQRSL